VSPLRAYSGLLRLLGRTGPFAWVGSRLLHRIDLRFRSWPLTTFGTDFPLCYVTIRGRRSGEPRTVPLLHVRDGERVVLIGSNWGRRHHPAWALNLEAARTATVGLQDGVERTMTARRATAEEFECYWPRALEFWPGYERYPRRARRKIRMFVLEPTA
jgi:deazaflavin-dependent oxidoreductase (nitroreductase family)